MSTRIVAHFGQQLFPSFYNHRISETQYNHIYTQLRSSGAAITDGPIKYKIYHLDSLIYRFKIDDPRNVVCYTEYIVEINPIVIPNAYTYIQNITEYQYEFQPINNYYNQHELEAITLSLNGTSIRFEKHPDYDITTYQIWATSDSEQKDSFKKVCDNISFMIDNTHEMLNTSLDHPLA
jgi:hypothetical protein